VPREYSLEAELKDLEALIDHLQAPRVDLFGFSCGGPVALAYAARHPNRVNKLVGYGTYLDGNHLAKEEVKSALVNLVRAHWGLGSQALADIFFQGADAATQQRFVVLQREGADAETAARLLELTYALDATPFVSDVLAPALVMHRRDDRAIRYEEGRKLAGRLRNATFVTLEGRIHLPWAGDAAAVLRGVRDFLGGRDPRPAGENAELRRDGEVWAIRFRDRQVLLKDAKGLADLARLLARPGQEVHVLEMLGAEAQQLVAATSAEPALDRQALASYKQRLEEIDVGVTEAADRGDIGNREKLTHEREALLRQLASDTGLRGRSRKLNDPVERARKAIAARLRDAIRRIEAVHSDLGGHLRGSVSTGTSCVYRPDVSVQWAVSPDPV
jgi:hypothetical protein